MLSKVFLRNNCLGNINFLSFFIHFKWSLFFDNFTHVFNVFWLFSSTLSSFPSISWPLSFPHPYFSVYFFMIDCVLHRVFFVWTWTWNSPLETSKLMGGYITEDNDSLSLRFRGHYVKSITSSSKILHVNLLKSKTSED